MVTTAHEPPVSKIEWQGAVRIIRSIYPPIDLFEDIADPADWTLLLSAEQKTNPRIMASVGNIDLVPLGRRVGGLGASYLMASFKGRQTPSASGCSVTFMEDMANPRSYP